MVLREKADYCGLVGEDGKAFWGLTPELALALEDVWETRAGLGGGQYV